MMFTPAGYCWPQSVRPGGEVVVHASGEGRVVVEVHREGPSPAVLARDVVVTLEPQPLGPAVPEDGCGWVPSFTINVGDDWRSGLYTVRFLPDEASAASASASASGGSAWGGSAFVPATAWFVVRAPLGQRAPALLVLATTTWNAYNDTGGRNLYTGAVAVSSRRPLAPGMLDKPDAAGGGDRVVDRRRYLTYTAEHGLGDWHGMAGWAGQERRFVAWADEAGFALDVATGTDLEDDPDLLDGYGTYVSVGHDEYWSWAMRDAVEQFVAAGGDAAFFSGNTAYWQVRHEGEGGHRMVGYKHRFEEDPQFAGGDQRLTTTMWADPIVGRPEAALTGVSFTRGGYSRVASSVPRGSGGYEVHRPDHWLFEGTGLRRGDQLGAAAVVVGYECDGCELALRDGRPVATGRGGTPSDFEVLATAPATPFDAGTTPLPLAPGGRYELEFHAERLLGEASAEACERLRHGHAVLGCHRMGGAAGAGTVVTVGCTDWAYGLPDPIVARVTANVLNRRQARPR